MSRPVKWSVAALAVAGCVLAFIALRQVTRPLEQQLLAAQGIQFLGEDFPADGGSTVFFFRLSYRQPMALLILHRDPTHGGNAEYQEVRMDSRGSFRSSVEVLPGSALEKKLVVLLQSATLRPNTEERFSKPPGAPSSERLKWAIERIRERKSKW